MIKRCWPFVVGLLGVIIAGAGLDRALAGGSAASAQFGIAAAVLSVYTTAICLLATDRDDRTLPATLVWGGALPIVIGLATVLIVIMNTHAVSALLTGLPWLLGPLLSVPLSRVLPDFLRYPPWRRPRRD
ncbi:hypothetical protein FOE78_12510 [Microlunatus elymi]|uniref:Uncharacterized protein n=1 Tax=Microlunatus elymi TaxID=2596828 RepID=A0A516PZM8_9ACTN|nr:hypothetical protein [Microlunatus elymi]QDP96624.1 hypothetical protein FOE78_12510 [Microlunatus elymi]